MWGCGNGEFAYACRYANAHYCVPTYCISFNPAEEKCVTLGCVSFPQHHV